MDSRESPLKNIDEDTLKNILEDLGATFFSSSSNSLIFSCICHGDNNKRKLYAYKNDGIWKFYCYICLFSGSLIDLLIHIGKCKDFKESMNFLSNYINTQRIFNVNKLGFGTHEELGDWSLFNSYTTKKFSSVNPTIIRDEKVLNLFRNDLFYEGWIDDHIDIVAMQKFGIRYCTNRNAIIIPNYDINGNFIGIRQRNLDKELVDAKKKYVPTIIQNTQYEFPTSYNFYGIKQNKETIKRLKKVVLFESEKSVLQCESYFPNNNFSLALLGSNISRYQANLLIDKLGINEVILAFDRDYVDRDDSKYEIFIRKVMKAYRLFSNFCSVYIIDDLNTGLLNLKDSPSDKGKEVFEELLRNKQIIMIEE